jgi:hypothetical protein
MRCARAGDDASQPGLIKPGRCQNRGQLSRVLHADSLKAGGERVLPAAGLQR